MNRPFGSRVFPAAICLLVAGSSCLLGCDRAHPPASSGSSSAGHILHLDPSSFAREVEQARGVVVVDFWAEWCGPCRVIAPTLKQLAVDYRGRVKVCKVDIDDHKQLAQRFGVRSIPTLILFVNGKERDQLTGARSAGEYRKWFETYLQ